MQACQPITAVAGHTESHSRRPFKQSIQITG